MPISAPADTHVIQKRDLIEMLSQFPDWAYVVVNIGDARAYIDRAQNNMGRVEIEANLDKDYSIVSGNIETDLDDCKTDILDLAEVAKEYVKAIDEEEPADEIRDRLNDSVQRALENWSRA